MENQPLCINIDNNANFELKSGFIHLLLIFNGLVREDLYTHLEEFHMVCVGMKPNGVDKEQVKLKAFPFSLKGAAKTWLFFILIRKEICRIQQSHGGRLSKCWERFEQLRIQCPHHQIPGQLLPFFVLYSLFNKIKKIE